MVNPFLSRGSRLRQKPLSPVILTGTRNRRLAIGRELGADRVINIAEENAVEVVKHLTGGIGADYVNNFAGAMRRSPARSWRPTARSSAGR